MIPARSRPALAFPALAAGLLALWLPAGHAVAEVFKWVDENGKAHFSSEPPPGRKSDRVKIGTTAPADGAPAARSWQEQVQQSNQQRYQDQKSQQEIAHKEAAAQQKCQEAQRALDILSRDRPISRKNAQGEREYMDDGQRSANIESARQRVATYCR